MVITTEDWIGKIHWTSCVKHVDIIFSQKAVIYLLYLRRLRRHDTEVSRAQQNIPMNRKLPLTSSIGLDGMTVTGILDAVMYRIER